MNLPQPRNIPQVFRAGIWTLLAVFLMIQPGNGSAQELFSASIDTLSSPDPVQDLAATSAQEFQTGDHHYFPPTLQGSHSAIFPEISLLPPPPARPAPPPARPPPSLPRPPPRS